jgi:CheY-like chemotaxis protein/Tfp pilus assembly protein PilZ
LGDSRQGEGLLLRAEITQEDRRIIAHTTELAPGSVLVRTDEPLKVGSTVKLELSFPRLAPPVELEAKVAGHQPPSGPGRLAGVTLAFTVGPGDGRGWLPTLLAGRHEPASGAGAGLSDRVRRILVVEDSAVIRDFLEAGADRFFQRRPMRVALDSAESADHAWELVQRESYELALVDLYLPGSMSGADLIRRIRARADVADLPVVGFSIGGDRAREEFLGAGADFFLEKPVMVRDLFATLERLTLIAGRGGES